MEVSQVYRSTNVKVLCNDQTFMETLNRLEIELSSRAHEDDEEKRKQKSASLAMAAFTQKGSGKDKPKPVCRDYMTDDGCKNGGQCSFQHPATVGRCLRCGSTRHTVAELQEAKEGYLYRQGQVLNLSIPTLPQGPFLEAPASVIGASVSSPSRFLMRNSRRAAGTEAGGLFTTGFLLTGQDGCTSPSSGVTAPRSLTLECLAWLVQRAGRTTLSHLVD